MEKDYYDDDEDYNNNVISDTILKSVRKPLSSEMWKIYILKYCNFCPFAKVLRYLKL